jgi:hypothetical protein
MHRQLTRLPESWLAFIDPRNWHTFPLFQLFNPSMCGFKPDFAILYHCAHCLN